MFARSLSVTESALKAGILPYPPIPPRTLMHDVSVRDPRLIEEAVVPPGQHDLFDRVRHIGAECAVRLKDRGVERPGDA